MCRGAFFLTLAFRIRTFLDIQEDEIVKGAIICLQEVSREWSGRCTVLVISDLCKFMACLTRRSLLIHSFSRYIFGDVLSVGRVRIWTENADSRDAVLSGGR